MKKKCKKIAIAMMISSIMTSTVNAEEIDMYYACSYGPGYDNLSSGDNFSEHQWGLKNDAELEYLELRNIYEESDSRLAGLMDVANIAGAELPEDLAGPGFYELFVTTAQKGIDINVKKAWELYDQSEDTHREVIVAIIDTGIEYNHVELKDAMWVNQDEIPEDGIDNDNNGYIDDIYGWNFFSNNNQTYVGMEDTHGTHAAGSVGATRGDGEVVGITDNEYVKIMSLKALGTMEEKGSEEFIIDAIHYAEANGASICNLSFGTDEHHPDLEQVMRESNMLFIVAAGNDGNNIDEIPQYPSAFDLPNIITVANLMFDGKLNGASNYGVNHVDIAAPGTYILSTITNQNYGFMTGSSMATPLVTGVAAMVYSYRTDLELMQVKDVILNSVRKLELLEGKIKTGGVLDAYAALQGSELSQ